MEAEGRLRDGAGLRDDSGTELRSRMRMRADFWIETFSKEK